MYHVHPKLSTPEDSQVIWRYFDFSGFLSLISNASLYFCRCDKFDDKWDGLYSATPELLEKFPLTSPTNVDIVRSHMGLKEFIRSTTFANCWHMNTDESAAMWEIYTAKNNGIAIASTIGRLKDAFKVSSRQIWIGEVTYGHFSDPDLAVHDNVLPSLLVKRREYEFEREVRALSWDKLDASRIVSEEEPETGKHDLGFLCPIDLRSLIDSVIIAPKLRSGMVQIVQSILDKFGMEEVKVRHSRLAEEPLNLDDCDPRVFNLSLRMDAVAIEMLMEAWSDYEEKILHDLKQYHVALMIQLALKTAARNGGYSIRPRVNP